MREAEVERACDALAVAYGYRVVRQNQKRPSKLHIGLPDRRYQGPRGCWYFEIKTDTDQLSKAQFDFLVAEIEGGCIASVGGALEIREVLDTLVRRPDHVRAVCRKHISFWASKGFRKEAA